MTCSSPREGAAVWCVRAGCVPYRASLARAARYMAKYPVVAQVEGTPFRDQRGHDARGMADRRAAEL